MDGPVSNNALLDERRRRLAAERTLEHTRRELARAHSALVANADRLSRGYLAEREHNLKLTERQRAVLQQRKEAAEKADRARRRLWHALEAMRDGFAVFDGNGYLVAANHVYLDLFDVGSELAPGCHAHEIFSMAAEEGAFDIGDQSPSEWAESQVARWDEDPVPPLVLHHYDGRVVRFQDRRAPDGDVVSLALDVTEQREREMSLTSARDDAQQLARAKAEFLARMSHEIRTPMNGVIGLSQMLSEQASDVETALYATTIRDSAEALLLIVNDTLDVSRLEAGRIELRLEPMDLEALLIDCLRLSSAIGIPDIQLGLAYPIGTRTRFVGDAGRLRQIVMNLLGNALKFTPAGHVIVRAQFSPREDVLTLTVEDTGPGVPDDMGEAIFEAFTQVEHPGHPMREGAGLGLTISLGLAERMGGSLELVKTGRGGATFALTVPLAPEGPPPVIARLPEKVAIPTVSMLRGDLAAERLTEAGCTVVRGIGPDDAVVLIPLSLPLAEQVATLARIGPAAHVILLGRREEADPDLLARAARILPVPVTGVDLAEALVAPGKPLPGTKRPRLLVADDNATNRLLIERMLRHEPFEVTLVEDGADAITAHERGPFDAVILDISMPRVDGFEAARQIRAVDLARGIPEVPLLALTAHVGSDMAERLRAAGFVAFLTKPLHKEALMEALSAALTPIST